MREETDIYAVRRASSENLRTPLQHDVGLVWYPSHGFHAPSGIVIGAYANGDAAIGLGD